MQTLKLVMLAILGLVIVGCVLLYDVVCAAWQTLFRGKSAGEQMGDELE